MLQPFGIRKQLILLVLLTLLIGTIIIVNLRLLGLTMTDRPVSEIAMQVCRWSSLGLVTTSAVLRRYCCGTALQSEAVR